MGCGKRLSKSLVFYINFMNWRALVKIKKKFHEHCQLLWVWETLFIKAFKSFWVPAWKPLQNHRAVRTDNWLVLSPCFITAHSLPLLQTPGSSLRLLFSKPNKHHFINPSWHVRFPHCLSAFPALLGSPQMVLRAEYCFPAKTVPAWNGKQWLRGHLAHTQVNVAGTHLTLFSF